MKCPPLKAIFIVLAALSLQMQAHADSAPDVSHALKKMLGSLPIEGIKDDLQVMVKALQKTPCGAGLTGCYATKSGPLQLYFFSSKQAQQTALLVIDKKLAMPRLLGDKVQKVMGETSLESPIFAISTTDFDLETAKMPQSLQDVIRKSYFNVSSMSFPAGVQLAARATLGGPIKLTMETFGIKANQLMMRAGLVIPIPTDFASGAGTGIGLAQALADGDTMKKAGADAAKAEAFVQFEFAPNSRLPMLLPPITLTDASFFINNSLTFGYKGNAQFQGVGDKKILMHFQTPLTPAGALDFLDFQFLMATPANFTLEDSVKVMVAMVSPDARLAQYGGGFIRNSAAYKDDLLKAVKPLSMFKLVNPKPAPEYRFGDATRPFPENAGNFNFVILGPLADGGPRLRALGDLKILGQTMSSAEMTAGLQGVRNFTENKMTVRLGPLGKQTFSFSTTLTIDKNLYHNKWSGNFAGQNIEVTMGLADVAIKVNASCINPFVIDAVVGIKPDLDIAQVFEFQPGFNVDPSKIVGCVGKELEAAYRKVAGEFKDLGGYTAAAANAELKKISDEAEKIARQAQEEAERAAKASQKAAEDAAKAAQKAAEDAEREYNRVKDGARDTANKATHAAANAFKDAGNAFKKLGKKKKHKKGPDPKFAGSVFDWDYYYDAYPDLVKAGVDLNQHWRDKGFLDGRRGSLEFHADYYWNRYTDVQALCPNKNRQCALQHWLDYGIEEGRQGSADFSSLSYMDRYPDVPQTLAKEADPDALEHWLTIGSDAGRNGKPDSAFAGPISGPVRVGGGGGSAWDDGCSSNTAITGFRLAAGRTVDRVQFKYPDVKIKMGTKSMKAGGWANPQGSSGNFTADVELAANEYIVQVDYRGGKQIDSLSFKTNTGKTYGPYGGTGGTPGTYKVTTGEKLACMAGRAGASIDQLIFTSTGPR